MKWIERLSSLLGGIAIGVLVIITTWSVITRYLLHSPLTWVEEASGLLLIWIIMIAAIACEARNEHLTIDLIEKVLSPKLKKILSIMISMISAGLLTVIAVQGLQLANNTAFRKTQILGVSYYWFNIAICIGAAGLILVTLLRIWLAPIDADNSININEKGAS